MLKVRHTNADLRLRLKARSERGEAMIRELCKSLGIELAKPRKPRKPRKS
jgi:hypothetical protein